MAAPNSGDQALQRAFNDADESLNVTVTAPVDLNAGDIEIGAVELKDGATDNRAKIDALANILAASMLVGVHDPSLPAPVALSDGLANPTTVLIGASGLVFNVVTGQWERQRTPTIYKASTGHNQTAGTTIWDPAAGKKFRLMGGIVTVTRAVAIAGGGTNVNFKLKDGAADIGLQWSFWVPTASVTTEAGTAAMFPFTLPGNGYLSAAADNNLVGATSVDLTTGHIAVQVYGTEE